MADGGGFGSVWSGGESFMLTICNTRSFPEKGHMNKVQYRIAHPFNLVHVYKADFGGVLLENVT